MRTPLCIVLISQKRSKTIFVSIWCQSMSTRLSKMKWRTSWIASHQVWRLMFASSSSLLRSTKISCYPRCLEILITSRLLATLSTERKSRSNPIELVSKLIFTQESSSKRIWIKTASTFWTISSKECRSVLKNLRPESLSKIKIDQKVTVTTCSSSREESVLFKSMIRTRWETKRRMLELYILVTTLGKLLFCMTQKDKLLSQAQITRL